tara:strand:- start:2961 stop:3977 length:1017 start_codon:yes stop_codon:yes gene_type:complete
MKIFVTGGCGFIGSNFIKYLKSQKNIKILNFDKLTYAGNKKSLSDIDGSKDYIFVEGDICDKKLVSDTLFSFKPDCVVNFAAESHVDRSISSPMGFVNTNIVGTATLLNACLSYFNANKLKNFKFVHISTDEVYGSLGKNGLFDENSNYNPSSPYSASKASSDHLVRSWWQTYGLPIIISNCSNNYGPYQFPEKLIPLMIINCINEKPLPIYGKGLNIRDWLFVEDHCIAILNLIEEGVVGDSYNIGSNNEKSNIEIVQTICKILDSKLPRKSGKTYKDLIDFVDDRPGHDFRYAIDSSKIKNKLGWKPLKSFNEGISETIQWYLDNESWWRNILENN